MSEDNKQQKRVLPQNELDFYLMTTNPALGSTDVSRGLKEQLTKYQVYIDEEGNKKLIPMEDLWELMAFYTRDLRLGNLSVFGGEIRYTQYFIDLAGDLLQAGMPMSFVACLRYPSTLLEISQSKGGFLRKMMNTLRQISISGEAEEKKKGLFGTAKKKEDYY